MKMSHGKTGWVRGAVAAAMLSGVWGVAHAGGGVADPSDLGALGAAKSIDVPLFESDGGGRSLVSVDQRLTFDVTEAGTLKGEFHLTGLPQGSISALLFGRRDDASVAAPIVAPVGVPGMEGFTGHFDLVRAQDGSAVSFTREHLLPGRYAIGVDLLIPPNLDGKWSGTLSVIPAVPEPAAWLMWCLGLCALAAQRGRPQR